MSDEHFTSFFAFEMSVVTSLHEEPRKGSNTETRTNWRTVRGRGRSSPCWHFQLALQHLESSEPAGRALQRVCVQILARVYRYFSYRDTFISKTGLLVRNFPVPVFLTFPSNSYENSQNFCQN